ncbi:MAG: hypothetical protein A2Y62_21470 [Candidatus Fischerbacteria bacterium RBG_13_37_8]|uniref:Uncharacterized protein n=1 Tax=Candidatus Fischerbacteria bacterium RBG_13_37_8 TaxID=1817863 RepID=A0A1F5VSJ4_9BACT|nr:MAG: hypothetical protein A2Y62_21470 [Candidatus Fischerbacteria bacterium RBG_13_37_8]
MIIWGGNNGSVNLNTGGRYNPTTDSWIVTSLTDAPPVRKYHTAVWTGTEMIIWGGSSDSTGGRYNPTTDSWIATSITDAPSPRGLHTAVWTGTDMIIWGGNDGSDTNTGGRYNPTADSWIATSLTDVPSGRRWHTAVWTGTEMIVWGGYNGAYLNTGGRYNPTADSWIATSTAYAPSQRYYHTAIWTGSEMIVWGGLYYINTSGYFLNSGGRYCANCNIPQGLFNNTAADIDPCSDTGVTITWEQDPGDWGDSGIGTRTYDVIRDGITITTLAYATTIYNDATGMNDTAYTYRIKYNNGCGISSITTGAQAADYVDILPCPDIGNAFIVTKSGTNAILSWSEVTCSDFAYYRIYGASDYSIPFPTGWIMLGLTTANMFSDPFASSYIAYKTVSVDVCNNESSY